MNVTTEQSGQVSIVRVGETRLMYPILSDFSGVVSELVAGGHRNIRQLASVDKLDLEVGRGGGLLLICGGLGRREASSQHHCRLSAYQYFPDWGSHFRLLKL